MNVNEVRLLGHAGDSPVMRMTGSGKPVATFSLATSRKWMDKSGETQEDTQWHRITVWGEFAQTLMGLVSKGSKVYVAGEIRYSKFQNEKGETRYSTDIVAMRTIVLNSKKGSRSSDDGSPEIEVTVGDDDDIPF